MKLGIGAVGSVPVVAFCDTSNNHATKVYKWAGGTDWIDLGFPGPPDGFGTDIALVVHTLDGKPVVTNRAASLFKWVEGTDWSYMGSPIPNNRFLQPSLIWPPTKSNPVITFVNEINGNVIEAYRWIGGQVWSAMGHPTVEEGGHPSIVIDPSDGFPIIIYTDSTNSWRAQIIKGFYD